MSIVVRLFVRMAQAMLNTLMFMLTCLFPRSAVTQYLKQEVIDNKKELKEIDEAHLAAYAKLSTADQMLMYMAELPITQARAAVRRYWKHCDPVVFANLYNKLAYSKEEAITQMKADGMPGYFQAKVLSNM